MKVQCHAFGLCVKKRKLDFILPFSDIVKFAITVSGDCCRTFSLKVFLALTVDIWLVFSISQSCIIVAG